MATNDRDAARIGLLEDLLAAKTPLAPIAAALARLTWDSSPLVVLQRRHIIAILERYLARDLGAETVREWAELVEVRDDIELEGGHDEVAKEALFTLATPETEGELDAKLAASLIASLTRGP
jgi:hypothetical protein